MPLVWTSRPHPEESYVRQSLRRALPVHLPWVGSLLALVSAAWLGARRVDSVGDPAPSGPAAATALQTSDCSAPQLARPAGRPVTTPPPAAHERLPPCDEAAGRAATAPSQGEEPPCTDRSAVALPAADTPWPQGRNAMWCTTLEMAWRELGRVALGGPPQPEHPNATATRLNAAPVVALPRSSSFVRVGRRTRLELKATVDDLFAAFPNAIAPPMPPPMPDPAAWFAMAYLEVALTFTHEFVPLKQPLAFSGPGDDVTPVEAFGIAREHEHALVPLRRQIEVLYDARDDPPPPREEGEPAPPPYDAAEEADSTGAFVLDLDRASTPTQLILARVDRGATLAATWARVAALVRSGRDRKSYTHTFGLGNTLAVPRMNWRIERAFPDLENLGVRGPKGSTVIDRALQITTLRLDHKGVEMKSLALLITRGASGRAYPFDRPFLVALRKRGSERPYFLLWVEDPALLVPAKAG